MKFGDSVTLAGLHKAAPNPARKWWTFWRPKMVTTNELAIFKVVAKAPSQTPDQA